jgi:hypothetical protein
MEKGMKVQHVDKSALFPAFGKADPHKQIAYVRNDLPKAVQAFVAAHEVYHLSDKPGWWLWREIRASLCVDWKHWKGFLLCAMMSLGVERLKFYTTRLKLRK